MNKCFSNSPVISTSGQAHAVSDTSVTLKLSQCDNSWCKSAKVYRGYHNVIMKDYMHSLKILLPQTA